MKFYFQFCQQLGLPSKFFISSLAVGFFGTMACLFLQVSYQHRELAIFCLPLVFLPILVVLHSAQGSYWEKQKKVFLGCLVIFFVSLAP